MNSNIRLVTPIGCIAVVLAGALPLLALQFGEQAPAVSSLLVLAAQLSPLTALATLVASAYVILSPANAPDTDEQAAYALGRKRAWLLLLPAAAAAGAVGLITSGLFVGTASSGWEALALFILIVHIIVPLVAGAAALTALIARSQKAASAEYFASFALAGPLFMAFLYAVVLLTSP